MRAKYFAVVFLCLGGLTPWGQCLENLLVDHLRNEFLALEDDLWDLVLHRSLQSKDKDPEPEIVERFHEFNAKMSLIPDDLLYGLAIPKQADNFFFVYSELKIIHDMFKKFDKNLLKDIESTNNNNAFENGQETAVDMTYDILYDDNNVNNTLGRIENYVFKAYSNLFAKIKDILDSEEYNWKNPNQPKNQVLFNIYNTIQLANLKGYVMMQFAYLVTRCRIGNYIGDDEEDNPTETSLKARKEYLTRSTYISSKIKNTFRSGKLWRSDPKYHVKGTTYDEVTKLLQGHVQNEVDLNSVGTCTDTCGDHYSTKSYGCYDSSSEYCKKMKPCQGQIRNCRFIESHSTACISPAWSYRRYEFIKYTSGRTMGQVTQCDKKNIFSWNRWFVHCSTCLCLCDEQGPNSDRYFSLRQTTADVKYNRIITGLRFVKRNRIFHLQIQEGELLPYGYINETTVRWVPVDDFKITSLGVRNGEDYHTLDYEHRKLYLDDLHVEKNNQVIVGVQFILRGGLRLRIKFTEFDFSTGKLSNNHHYLHLNGEGIEINTDDLDIPIKTPSPSTPNWLYPTHLHFTHTSFEKDAAQTTVPFIDIQDVAPEIPLPLKAVGIYYKGKPGHGGFIAPTVTTYDFARHLTLDFPDAKERREKEAESITITPA